MSDKDPGKIEPTPIAKSLPRLALRFSAIGAFAYGAFLGFELVTTQIMKLEDDAQAGAMVGLLVFLLMGYAVLIAIPFMPGVEIGIALLLIQGASVAPFVYLATLSGMFFAFAIGQYVPLSWLHALFRDMRIMRACQWLDQIQSSSRQERLANLTRRLPTWIAKIAVDYRYVTLGLLINLPGSIAIGGGGGIMMIAGFSRLFQTKWVILMLVVAVLPVPLAVWILGTEILR